MSKCAHVCVCVYKRGGIVENSKWVYISFIIAGCVSFVAKNV